MQELLVKLLNEKGVTQYAMAKAAGVSKSSVTDWLKGRCKPSVCALVKLSQYFGVSIETFVNADTRKGASK